MQYQSPIYCNTFHTMLTDSQIDSIIKDLFDKLEFKGEPRGLYDPLRYMIQIGGKRVRPGLCLRCYSFFSDTMDDSILSPAAAIEVFHSFTLMHDDIMDRSPLRRGVPTVWKKWNEDTAIPSGDVMLIDAYKLIAKAPQRVLGSVMRLFSDTSAQVCEGQQLDMDFESQRRVSMEEYETMIGLKTAVLIACAAKMGAIIGGAGAQQSEAIYRYGYNLGMAFQVADDYLDAFGDEKVFGKPIGGDILNRKKSWLTIRSLQKSSDPERFMDEFEKEAGTEEQKNEKIRQFKSIYTALEVDKDAKSEIERYNALALGALQGAGLGDEHIACLQRFAEKLTGRAK